MSLVSLFASVLAGSAEYRVVDLGLGYASSLNDMGLVGGYGFVWDKSHGRIAVGEGWTYVSENGLVAGSYKPSDTDSRPALWNPIDGVIELGAVGHRGYATGINNEGVVSLWYGDTSPSGLEAGMWSMDTGLISLAYLFPDSSAAGINNKGQILINGFGRGSYIYNTKTGKSIYIGTPRAREINENGKVVFDDLNAIWSIEEGYKYMQTPIGYSQLHGAGLNDIGIVVGACFDGQWNAIIWDPINETRLLNDLIDPKTGWFIEYAMDINNYGQIVGSGIINGKSHAILLIPIPEPNSLLLLTLVGIFLRKR